MEARGFGSVVTSLSRRQAVLSQVGLLAGLLGILAGLFVVAFFSRAGPLGPALVALGLLAMLVVFAFQGRRVHRTRYRRTTWRTCDTITVVASAVVVAVILVARAMTPETLYYDPFQPGSFLPSFSPVVGAALLLLAVPAVLVPSKKEIPAPRTEHGT
jgi:cation transport ATPase